METATTAQTIGFFIWLFFITAGTATFIFLVSFIPAWISLGVINRFNPKLAEKISKWCLEF